MSVEIPSLVPLHDISAPVTGNYPKFCVDHLLFLNPSKYDRALNNCADQLHIKSSIEMRRKLADLKYCAAVKIGLVDYWSGGIIKSELDRLMAKSPLYNNTMIFGKVAKQCTFWYTCILDYCDSKED